MGIEIALSFASVGKASRARARAVVTKSTLKVAKEIVRLNARESVNGWWYGRPVVESCCIALRAVSWSQEIRCYPSTTVEGRLLNVSCTTRGKSDLQLSDGAKLADFEIDLSIIDGEPDLKQIEKYPFLENALGGIWYVSEQSYVHGWFHLKSNDYAAVWDQVRNGGYVHCAVDLWVNPVEYKSGSIVWSGNAVSIESADFRFARRPVPDTSRNKEQVRDVSSSWSKRWAVPLFVTSALMWFFPQWNGLLFEPSRDMTTGEGRIIAAVLLIGGLLLWFLGSPRSTKH